MQDILAKDFNLGSFSILMVNDKMPTKDILKMEEKMTLSLYTSKPENSSSAWLQFFENQTISVILL